MERDFMGLLQKSQAITVKKESNDGSNDSEKGCKLKAQSDVPDNSYRAFAAAMRRSGLQLSFSNTAAGSSQVLSFNSTQDQGGCHKRYPPNFSQRSLALDKQGGHRYPLTGHGWQPNASLTNPTIPASISSVLSTHLAPTGLNLVSSSVGGASIMTSASIPPPNCPVVGSTDLRISPSISTGPCQLTIFYNGSVCVYGNVSPEKAQAIMLLAGNGDPTNSNATKAAHSSTPKLQPAALKPSANDTTIPNQSLGFSSSISLPQPVSSLSKVALSCAAEVTPVKPVTAAPIKCPEPPKSPPVGVNLNPSAVPQARKASLARFLEKRKERVIGASPYVVSKNTSECSVAGPVSSTFATNSATSSPLPASS